jgi:hypothetical protein
MSEAETIEEAVKKGADKWEAERERIARVQEAQIAELEDVVRHRNVAEMFWEQERQALAAHRAKAESCNERLVTAQERQAEALERIAKAAEQGK